MCTVCKQQYKLIEDHISKKKSKLASVQLPVDQDQQNKDDFNDNYNDDYNEDYISVDIFFVDNMGDGLLIGEKSATAHSYISEIYGLYEGLIYYWNL